MLVNDDVKHSPVAVAPGPCLGKWNVDHGGEGRAGGYPGVALK